MRPTAGRLLELLSLLQTRPVWRAPELAERLGITERTVRRDVSRLRELGYPVEAEAGPAGGYRLGPGRALPPLLLTDDEAVAVAIGLQLATRHGLTGVDESLLSALTKLEDVLPPPVRQRVAAITSSTVLLSGAASSTVAPDVVLTLARGCRHRERVRFRYRSGDAVDSERRVEPYRLVHAGRRWYLVALDLDRADWRTFRVDRIRDAELTGHRFERTEEPDAAALVSEGTAIRAYDLQAEVLLRAGADVCAELVPPTVGTLEAVEGGTLLRLGANDLDWIAHFLASMPVPFEIRSPPELRGEVRALAQRLLDTDPDRPTGER